MPPREPPALFAVTKKESDGNHPASHYLVVESPFKPSTWHLRVRDVNGKPDHTLMGGAWAALHGGYRGKKYQGPNKAEALSKLIALYKSEKMDLPNANSSADPDDEDAIKKALDDFLGMVMAHETGPKPANQPSGTFTYSADFAADGGTEDHGIVRRPAKLFEVGDYPDKSFTFDESDLDAAIQAFAGPVEVDLEHVPTVLQGQLGQVERVWKGDDGKSLMGEVALPGWLDRALPAGKRKVSSSFDRATKTLQGLALVLNPRVPDAALMAAFTAESGDLDAFFAAAHMTPTGQESIQAMHGLAVKNGAVCNNPAAMASKAESKAIQAMHDTAVENGAQCESVGSQRQPGYRARSFFNRAGNPARSSRSMNPLDWLKTKAQEDGYEVSDDDLRAAFSDPEANQKVADLEAEIKRRDQELIEFKAAKEAHEQQLAAMAAEKRHAEAVSFADTAMRTNRIVAGSTEALTALYERIAVSDSAATFAEGEKPTAELLAAFVATLPDVSIFTTQELTPNKVLELVNASRTEGVTGKESAQNLLDLARKYPNLAKQYSFKQALADAEKTLAGSGQQA